MIPTLLITLREVIEASLIVATILGMLVKLNQKQSIRTVWLATVCAIVASFALVFAGSMVGVNLQRLYAGISERLMEGSLLILSACFVTWAVFVLHKHFARKKMHLLEKVKETLARDEKRGVFLLTFTAVLREGIEIAVFLSTMYLTTSPLSILAGFSGGIVLGLAVSMLFFSATIRMPVYVAFRVTSLLLIVFAGGLLARGIGEFLEITPLTQLPVLHFGFLPASTSYAGSLIQTLFGLTRSMNPIAAISYTVYIFLIHRLVFMKTEQKRG